MSLIVAGTGLKYAFQKSNNTTYRIGEKKISRQKVHTAATLLLMGAVIQTVSNAMQTLDGRQLLLDQKIIAAYAFSLAIMIFKK